MTGPESEGAVILFDIVIQLLKLCGAFQNFDCSPKWLSMDSLYSVLASLISDSLPAPKVGGHRVTYTLWKNTLANQFFLSRKFVFS